MLVNFTTLVYDLPISTVSEIILLLFWIAVVDTTSSNEQTDLCTVKIRGVYPTLNVTDVRGTGCAQGYSRRRLWELFSIDRYDIGWNVLIESEVSVRWHCSFYLVVKINYIQDVSKMATYQKI